MFSAGLLGGIRTKKGFISDGIYGAGLHKKRLFWKLWGSDVPPAGVRACHVGGRGV